MFFGKYFQNRHKKNLNHSHFNNLHNSLGKRFHGDLYHGELRTNIFFFHIFQSVGPYIVDTTKPKFYGQQIDVRLVNNYLIANWSANAFQDSDDPYPMKFQFAVGWYLICIINSALYYIFIHI